MSDWHQQVTLFDKAIKEFGRIDYVYPIAGIGERAWLPKSAESSGWIRPDFTVDNRMILVHIQKPFLIVQRTGSGC